MGIAGKPISYQARKLNGKIDRSEVESVTIGDIMSWSRASCAIVGH